MAEILPRHYLYAIIIFTIFAVAGVSLLGEFFDNSGEFSSNENVRVYEQFNRSFNKINDVTEKVEGLQSDIEQASAERQTFGILNGLISTGWQMLKLLFGSFNFMGDAIGALSTMFGIPSWILSLVILLITVMLVFSILSAIFQREI